MKEFIMLVRREFWEHRSLWITPILVAALMLVAVTWEGERLKAAGLMNSVGTVVPAAPDADLRGRGGRPPMVLQTPGIGMFGLHATFYVVAALLIGAYLLDCLYAERRDRSVLFWKSMPISDSAVVWSKVTVGLLAVPLIFYVAATLTGLIATGIFAAMGLRLDLGSWQPASVYEWFQLQGVVLYGVVATVLWYAPFAAYLLLISAFAKRSVLAWAIVPPVVIALVERVVFDTTVVGQILQRGYNELYRLAFRINQQIDLTLGDVLRPMRGGGGGGGGRGGGGPRQGFDARLDPTELLASPQLWWGLAVAGLLIWAAIAVRRRSQDA